LDVVDTRHRPVSAQQPMHRQWTRRVSLYSADLIPFRHTEFPFVRLHCFSVIHRNLFKR
jgi:hypothetical protein